MTLRTLGVIGLCGWLTGCTLGPHRDQLTLVTLEPAGLAEDGARALATPLDWQLLIEEPLADPVLADVRIVRRVDAGVGVYRGMAWSDRATALLQRVLVQSFQNDGRLPAVARSSARLHGDVLLASELQAFQVEDDARVVLRLQVQLIRTDRQQLIASRRFETSVPLPAGRGAAGVAATFQQALDAVLPHLVDWTLEQGHAGREAPR